MFFFFINVDDKMIVFANQNQQFEYRSGLPHAVAVIQIRNEHNITAIVHCIIAVAGNRIPASTQNWATTGSPAKRHLNGVSRAA